MSGHYHLETLRKACDRGEHYKYLFFWGHTPAADGHISEACLSQWWMCRFQVDGQVYTCAEQYMMAEKARMFGDEAMLEKIMASAHPKEMKAYGRAVQGFDQETWDKASYGIVKRGNMAKFSQDPALWAFLKGTKDRVLVEASPRDRIWGIGMGKSDPDASDPLKWRGMNLLGFALTEVRDTLLKREETQKSVLRDRDGLTEEDFLASYEPGDYARPSVATDMVIFTVTDQEAVSHRRLPQKELRILLIKRGGHPYLGCWALPGGFVQPTETTEQAAGRELLEETGVDDVYLEQLYTFSQPDRDPRTWVMSCSYMALIDSSQVKVQAGDDADQAAWFKLSTRLKAQEEGRELWEITLSHEAVCLTAVLEKEAEGSFVESQIREQKGLAFDHSRIIACGLERLRGKLQYTDLAFHLLPGHFTLTQLQQVYEVILDKKLPVAAFRRKAAPMVRETGQFTENERHRPSRLYEKERKGGKG